MVGSSARFRVKLLGGRCLLHKDRLSIDMEVAVGVNAPPHRVSGDPEDIPLVVRHPGEQSEAVPAVPVEIDLDGVMKCPRIPGRKARDAPEHDPRRPKVIHGCGEAAVHGAVVQRLGDRTHPGGILVELRETDICPGQREIVGSRGIVIGSHGTGRFDRIPVQVAPDRAQDHPEPDRVHEAGSADHGEVSFRIRLAA